MFVLNKINVFMKLRANSQIASWHLSVGRAANMSKHGLRLTCLDNCSVYLVAYDGDNAKIPVGGL